MSDNYRTAAGSILTTEARHSAYLRAAVGKVPFAQAFDNPLDLKGVYTVASPSIAFRPSGNSALPVKAFPALTMSSMDAVMTGSQVQLMAGSGFNATSSDVNAAFITVTGPVWAPPKSMGDGKFTITIPKGVAGQSYVIGKETTMGTPSSMAVMGMGDTKDMTMPTPSNSMAGSLSSFSATASASASPIYTGAAQKKSGIIAGVVASLFAATDRL
ncbi:hypothetical protein HAV15_011089 [Penicillium sp. str. |nr:hypothetical protein HAV15_011089 [Penicillium sp. str. \